MISPATVDAIRDELTGHLRARIRWDEPPGVYTVHHGDGGCVFLSRIPLPDFVWELDRPSAVVSNLAVGAAGRGRRPDGTHLMVARALGPLLAVAFRYEAWTVSSDAPDPAAREAALRKSAGGSVPSFKGIPGRSEQRCMTAVDADGGRYMASATRITDGRPEATTPTVHYFPRTDSRSLSGDVVNAVAQLTNVIKPAPPQHPAAPRGPRR
ncbi:hypothetical protein [Streptomyces antibioticus]|uniref:hypothetical protein n=1 Tax=Streptomyces antibioticus TaxID=1890 RepID=UPI0036CC2672